MSAELKALLAQFRDYQMSPEVMQERRISFAYGNTSYENKEITREDAVRSSWLLSIRDGQKEESPS